MVCKKMGLFCLFSFVVCSGCATTDHRVNSDGPMMVSSPSRAVVSYGGYSPYYWSSEPESYYPQTGYYSPGYHYTSGRVVEGE